MKRNKCMFFLWLFWRRAWRIILGTDTAYAYDDFGLMAQSFIEATYHVHRSHRFIMGFAGMVVKFWHVGGVKNFKAAIFEDQHFRLHEGQGR